MRSERGNKLARPSAPGRLRPFPLKGNTGTEARKTRTPEEWARRAYLECFVVVAADALIMGGIFFALVGSALNGRSWAVYGYVFMFVPLLSVLAPVSVVMGARLAYMRGKWDLRETITHAGQYAALRPSSPWRWCAVLGLPPGILAAGIVSLLLWLSGAPHVSPVWVVLVSFAAAAVVGAAVLAIHLKADLICFAEGMSGWGRGGKAGGRLPPPIRRRRPAGYFLMNYALPWILVAVVLALNIGIKGAREEALKLPSSMAGAEAAPFAYSMAATFLVIAAWTFYEAQIQVRPDVHQGLCGGTGKKPLGAGGIIAALILASAGIGAAFWIAFKLAGVAATGVAAAVIIDLVVSSSAALAGSLGGMHWGRTAESRMVEGQGREGS